MKVRLTCKVEEFTYRQNLSHNLTWTTPGGIEVYQHWQLAILYHVIKAGELLFLCVLSCGNALPWCLKRYPSKSAADSLSVSCDVATSEVACLKLRTYSLQKKPVGAELGVQRARKALSLAEKLEVLQTYGEQLEAASTTLCSDKSERDKETS